MPKISKYRKAKKMKDKVKALELHKNGFTLREIGKSLGYSYEWVRLAIKELSTI
jgi:hypothetical protein